MDALGDLVARERRSDDPALVVARENRTYDYRRFCTTAWKTGNFWRGLGVHADATVAVADDPAPEVVFSFLGAALLGARTRFGLFELPDARPPDTRATLPDARATDERDHDARVVVAPHDEIGDYEPSPGTQRVAYGGSPDDPTVAHFERDVWSENPAFPETPIDPETVALVTENREFSHAELLASARKVADEWSLEPGDEVAVRAPLADPGTVVAGVVAPLLAGAATFFPGHETSGVPDDETSRVPDGETSGDYAVAEGDAPETEVLGPSEVV